METNTLGQITGFLATGSMNIRTTPLAKEQSATLLGLEVFTEKRKEICPQTDVSQVALEFQCVFHAVLSSLPDLLS